MQTTIVWFRNDLRVHDHPALQAAVQAGNVVPVFILDRGIFAGRHASANRNRFLLESLADLRSSLKQLGGDLVIREGTPNEVLLELAKETGASAVYYTADFTPYAISRDKAVKKELQDHHLTFHAFGGRLIIDELESIKTKAGTVQKVFTPFWKNWSSKDRRAVAEVPTKVSLPHNVPTGRLPNLADISPADTYASRALKGGESAGRERLEQFLSDDIQSYSQNHNDMGADRSSRLSAYIHFGCVSVREIELRLPEGAGPAAFHRQLAWRDFYHYVLFYFPKNSQQEYQERYRQYPWEHNSQLLQAWKDGQTGYPVVDAAMRQLLQEGWMHNRGRLIVGSFLTKDLGIDWRDGETYFMQQLLDGDQANNNGNWQWIASVGVDPAPVFRRLYNPASQQATYDPDNVYVHRYVPELKNVPPKYLAEPWKMPQDIQEQSGCIIGQDYPAPIVDHAEARKAALEKYRSVTPRSSG